MDGKTETVCLNCNRQIDLRVVRCAYCGVLVEKTKQTFNQVMPIWKYCVLVLFTCGLYEIWWFFKTWSFVKQRLGIGKSWAHIGSAIGTCLPILSLFFMWKLCSSMRDIASENKLPERYSVRTLYLIYILLSVFSAFCDRSTKVIQEQTGPFSALTWMGTLFLAMTPALWLYPLQQTINDYWQLHQPELPVRSGFTKGELVVLAIGLFLVVAVVVQKNPLAFQ